MGNDMEIREMSVTDIIPYENNPRHNEQAVEAVAESIKQCGYVAPIIVDENNVILAGHTRLKAVMSIGGTQIPVIVRYGLTDEQKRKYRILDNKTSEFAEWDLDKLDIELEGLDFDGFDFGFDLVDDEGFGTDFDLPEGDKAPVQNITFTFSDDEAEIVNEAISEMKRSEMFKGYNNPENQNSNGNALFLVVNEWLQQKI